MTADQHISAAETLLENLENQALNGFGKVLAAQAHALVARAIQAERDWYTNMPTAEPGPAENPRWGV